MVKDSVLKNIIIYSSALLFFSCNMKNGNAVSEYVTFNIGFDELKTYQGVLKNQDGSEEVYFYKTNFHPIIKFFDLNGCLTDSISLERVAKDIGRIGRISLISKDSIILMSYQKEKIVGIDREENYLFDWDLEYLNETIDDHYKYYGSTFPTCITSKNNSLVLVSSWEYNKEEKSSGMESQLTGYESYKKFYSDFSNSYHLCKIDSVFSNQPKIHLSFKEYYRRLNDSVKCYIVNARYFVDGDHLLLGNTYDRNVYRINVSSMEIIDTIPVIPLALKIPSSYVVKEEDLYASDAVSREDKDIKDNCYIANILYSNMKEEYYFFIKTGIDESAFDEKGYAFQVFVYDKDFNIKREVSVDSDIYMPKSAMMTSKGILIEQNNPSNPYGTKTFCILDF